MSRRGAADTIADAALLVMASCADDEQRHHRPRTLLHADAALAIVLRPRARATLTPCSPVLLSLRSASSA